MPTSAARTRRMALCALFTALTTAGGLALFRRKDLK